MSRSYIRTRAAFRKVINSRGLRGERCLSYASEGYIEHIRKAHFALVTVSAGLLLLVLSAKPYDSRKALMQMQGILKLRSNWSPKWVHEHESQNGSAAVRTVPQNHPSKGYFADAIPVFYGPESEAEQNQGIIVKVTLKKSPAKPLLYRLVVPSNQEFIWLEEERESPTESSVPPVKKPVKKSHDTIGRSELRILDHVPDRLDSFATWWKSLGTTSHHRFAELQEIYTTCDLVGILEPAVSGECEILDEEAMS